MRCTCGTGRAVGARFLATWGHGRTGAVARTRNTGTISSLLPSRPFVSSGVPTPGAPSPGDDVRHSSVVPRAFLGVGAPELVLVGVVALVLFGPKGLAQAAKSFGQVVKSVAPTLRELTDISTDLKSTIEDEIGLSEIRSELESTLSPLQGTGTGRPPAAIKSAVEEDPDIEAKRAASLSAAWGASEGNVAGGVSEGGVSEGGVSEGGVSEKSSSSVDALSTEELERIIAARKAAQGQDDAGSA